MTDSILKREKADVEAARFWWALRTSNPLAARKRCGGSIPSPSEGNIKERWKQWQVWMTLN